MARSNFISGTVYTSAWGNAVENVILTSAVGDGTTDDTTALQADLNECSAAGGGTVRLYPGKTYKITSKLTIASYCFLVGDGTSTLQGSYVDFTNTTNSAANRYSSNALFVDLSGLTSSPYTQNVGNGVIGVKFLFIPPSNILTGGTKRSVGPIAARCVTDVTICNNSMTGFMTTSGIRVASLIRGKINDNVIYDFFDNNDWTGTPTQAQITGIEVDNDRPNGVGSYETQICRNTIKNMVCGAQSISTGGGYQSDGINIASLTGDKAHHLNVSDNIIAGVGEGIDVFGEYCTFSDNQISECYIFGLKFIHGANHNSVSGGVIRNFGLGGIVFAGSSSASVDTYANNISNIVISTGDYLGSWVLNSSYGIGFLGNASYTKFAKTNTVDNVSIEMGANLKYAVLDLSEEGQSAGTAGLNICRRITVATGAALVRMVRMDPTSSYTTMFNPTIIRVAKSVDQTVTSGGGDQLVTFTSEQIDQRNEWASNRFTCVVDGYYDIKASVRIAGLVANDATVLSIRLNGSSIIQASYEEASTSDVTYKVDVDNYKLVKDDYIEIYIQPNTWAANKDITAGSNRTWVTVKAST